MKIFIDQFKPIVKKTMSIALILCLSTVLALPVLAETSNALINFTGGTGPTKPVDPDDPHTEEPNYPGPGVNGQLAIVKVTPLDFGETPITANKAVYDIKTDSKPNIQVVDLRGTTDGWTLDASMSYFEDNNGNTVLPGAFLTFVDGELNSTVDMKHAPLINSGAVLDPSDPLDPQITNIVTAQDGVDPIQGMGLWVNRWYNGNTPLVNLTVPAGANSVKGEYKATITWVLTSAA